MRYQVVIPRPARKHIDAIPQPTRGRIAREIAALRDDPRPPGCLKLKGAADEYRIRIGDYRVRYGVDDNAVTVTVIDVRHRKDIYRT